MIIRRVKNLFFILSRINKSIVNIDYECKCDLGTFKINDFMNIAKLDIKKRISEIKCNSENKNISIILTFKIK